ncbi:MAG: type II secretion system protein [Verrucomicrobiota bacterium]|nr:type II secretion system protein [Verrucomicrobiota bacterium]
MSAYPSGNSLRILPSKMRQAFSLIEVLMALAILSMVAMAVVGNVILATKMAHANVMNTTATATAQSFLEQIKSMQDSEITAALNAPGSVPLKTISLSALLKNAETHNAQDDTMDISIYDPLYLGIINEKKIMIDQRDNKPVTMTMKLRVNITPMTNGYGYLIELFYSSEFGGLTSAFLSNKEHRLFIVKSFDQAA